MTFLPFRASASSFFWLFLFSDLFSSTLLFSLTLPISAFHLSILSEVWLLNFLRWYSICKGVEITSNSHEHATHHRLQVVFRMPPPPILCSMKELAGCNVEDLRYVGVPYPEREIPHHGFAGCHALLLVDIADSVTRLGPGPSAFAGCSSLRNLAIPGGVTEIGQGTFDGCKSLANLSIPRGVITIGKRAFIGCSSLTKLAIPPQWQKSGSPHLRVAALWGVWTSRSLWWALGVMPLQVAALCPVWTSQTVWLKFGMEPLMVAAPWWL